MFIQTETTPNPATLKFLPGRPVLDSGTFEARDAVAAEASPLAKALMELPGVSGVFLAPDFISVTKNGGEWAHLKPAVLGVVTEFFLTGAPVLSGAAAATRGRVLPRRGFRDGRDDQGADRDAGPPGGRRRRRRHRLQGLPRRHRLSDDERRLLRLPLLDRDPAPRHREPAQALPARPGEVGRAGVRRGANPAPRSGEGGPRVSAVEGAAPVLPRAVRKRDSA